MNQCEVDVTLAKRGRVGVGWKRCGNREEGGYGGFKGGW